MRTARIHAPALVLAGSLFLGTAHAGPPSSPEEPVRVVTTLSVLRDLAREVGGEHVRVESLTDPRQDPHYVEPRPTLMQAARRADLFVEVGLQLELWADKVVSGSGNPGIQRGAPGHVVASEGIPTLELPRTLSREWGDVHPYGNPHVWLDPIHAREIAENLAGALATVDPSHSDAYAEGAERFGTRIEEALFGPELVREVGGDKLSRLARRGRLQEYLEERGLADRLGGWLARAAPLRGRPIVTYHKTWIYFAERFGFEIPLEIEEKPGIPPSARHRDEVLETMRRRDVRTILQTVFHERTAADWLAERTGACVAAVPIDVGPEVGVEGYFELIDRILDALLACEERS